MTAEQLIRLVEISTPLLKDVILLVFGSCAGMGIMKFWYKKEKRFYKNMKKPFSIFKLTNNPSDMEMELEMLKNNGLFTVPKSILSDLRNLDWIDKQSLIIIAVDKTTSEEDFKNIYDRAQNNGTPVIIYTLGNLNLDLCKSRIVQSYSKRVIVTQPLRLLI